MPAQRMMTAIGCISGTSMDGIDVAVVVTDGADRVAPGGGTTYAYAADLARDLRALVADPALAETDPLVDLERRVTDAHVQAVQRFMADNDLAPAAVDVVGMHGQTVYHRPERRFTRQLCDGARAAATLERDVVTEFRLADVAAGGQGAPFAPLYHRALAVAGTITQPLMMLNLGGVGNVTYIDGETVIAFDTGPASALIDDFVRRRFGVAFDDGGRIAAQGHVDQSVLAALMANPFFALPPPKSLDRNDFHARAKAIETLADHDAVATLAAFTIAATADAVRHVPKMPARWLVTGGGRLNRTFMDGLARSLGVPVEPVEAAGWNGDIIEAQCFGYLAVRSRAGLPLSVPSTTGVPHAMCGGRYFPARGRDELSSRPGVR